MHRTHLCSHCLRRRVLLWASAFFVALGGVGALGTSGSVVASGAPTTPASAQTASR